MRKSPTCFDKTASKQVGDFFKFLWPFQKSWKTSGLVQVWFWNRHGMKPKITAESHTYDCVSKIKVLQHSKMNFQMFIVYTHCTAMFLVWEKSSSSLVNWNDHITVIREIFDAKDASAVLNKHACTLKFIYFEKATTIWRNLLPHYFDFWRY